MKSPPRAPDRHRHHWLAAAASLRAGGQAKRPHRCSRAANPSRQNRASRAPRPASLPLAMGRCCAPSASSCRCRRAARPRRAAKAAPKRAKPCSCRPKWCAAVWPHPATRADRRVRNQDIQTGSCKRHTLKAAIVATTLVSTLSTKTLCKPQRSLTKPPNKAPNTPGKP